jgi:TPR repeat protein
LAQRNLGLHYLRGEGVPPDALTAMSWFRKAADQGDADAQCDLGFMYGLGGEPVPQDYVSSLMWYILAAAGGNTDAQRNLDSINSGNSQMTPAQIAEAQRLAREWKPASLAPITP